MIRGYFLGFGMLQLAAILMRWRGLTNMPWAAVLAPLWLGPVLIVAAACAGAVCWLAVRVIAAIERAMPIDDDRAATGRETALPAKLPPSGVDAGGTHAPVAWFSQQPGLVLPPSPDALVALPHEAPVEPTASGRQGVAGEAEAVPGAGVVLKPADGVPVGVGAEGHGGGDRRSEGSAAPLVGQP